MGTQENANESTPLLSTQAEASVEPELRKHIGDSNTYSNSTDTDRLIQELKEENAQLKARLSEVSGEQDHYYSTGPVNLALRRLPALFVTLFLEMIGGIVIGSLDDVFLHYSLIVSFMPIVSALAGKQNVCVIYYWHIF